MEFPKWHEPKGDETPVKLKNSLTGKLETLRFQQGKRNLSFYCCGPTVYDWSHLGHARTYVGFDIVRRVLEDYFHLDVTYVVNVTDVDDKIIKKGNLERGFTLLQELEKRGVDVKKEKEILEKDKAEKEKAKQLTPVEISELIERLKDLGKDVLDKDFLENETDYTAVSSRNEKLFWEDMETLNVREPSVITRVTEYIPEIIAFVQQIIDNGFAYENMGNVYFDIQAFRDAGFDYGKLDPNMAGASKNPKTDNEEAVEKALEGEGQYSEMGKKKNPFDFALWKKSKVGEPKWNSPWGDGRPGWHIECSAMACSIFGGILDIHSGGCDLNFPHHDNELAQTQAFFQSQQWVNYFLHTGHLHIDGLSMSKSKKNFITIREALEFFNANQIRILFLKHEFQDPMDYSKQSMDEAKSTERFFANFFQNVQSIIRDQNKQSRSYPENWSEVEVQLNNVLSEIKEKVHQSLQENINTKAVMEYLSNLVQETNVYISKAEFPKVPLLKSIAMYLTKMFRIFGLIDGTTFGFNIESDGGNYAKSVTPFIDIFSTFRGDVRKIAIEEKSSSDKNGACAKILKKCDDVRDFELPYLGVRLEDKSADKTIWKLEDKNVLITEMNRKKWEAEQKALEKAKAKKRQQAKDNKYKISPSELFKAGKYEGKYSEYDEDGIPTKDAKGEALPKSQLKKLKKIYDGHKKKYDKSNKE